MGQPWSDHRTFSAVVPEGHGERDEHIDGQSVAAGIGMLGHGVEDDRIEIEIAHRTCDFYPTRQPA